MKTSVKNFLALIMEHAPIRRDRTLATVRKDGRQKIAKKVCDTKNVMSNFEKKNC